LAQGLLTNVRQLDGGGAVGGGALTTATTRVAVEASAAAAAATTTAAAATEAAAAAAEAAAAERGEDAGHKQDERRLAQTHQQQQGPPPRMLLQAQLQVLIQQLRQLLAVLQPAAAAAGLGTGRGRSQLPSLSFSSAPAHCDHDRLLQLARDFVRSVMAHEPVPIAGSGGGSGGDNGMWLMPKVVNLETGRPFDVVIRAVTRPFWQACIDAADQPDVECRVCAIGTSGIGKTACTPYLIKMLLERGTTVVYHVRTHREEGWIFEFIPRPGQVDALGGKGHVDANVYPEKAGRMNIPSLQDPSTYYVVDPSNTTDSCDPSCLFRPRVIIVAEPDARHWGDRSFFKRRDTSYGTRKFFPVWELDELLQARAHLGPWMTEQQVKDRHFQVGGVPSHVFSDEEHFQFLLDRQQVAVLQLRSPEQLERLANPQSLAVFDEARPESLLVGYRVPETDDGSFSSYQVAILATRAVGRALAEAARMAARARSDAGPNRRSPRLASKSPGTDGPRKGSSS
jgi:hypothetical protein